MKDSCRCKSKPPVFNGMPQRNLPSTAAIPHGRNASSEYRHSRHCRFCYNDWGASDCTVNCPSNFTEQIDHRTMIQGRIFAWLLTGTMSVVTAGVLLLGVVELSFFAILVYLVYRLAKLALIFWGIRLLQRWRPRALATGYYAHDLCTRVTKRRSSRASRWPRQHVRCGNRAAATWNQIRLVVRRRVAFAVPNSPNRVVAEVCGDGQPTSAILFAGEETRMAPPLALGIR